MGQPQFEVELAPVRTGVKLTIRGELDIDTVRRLERARDCALADQPEWLLIDLRPVGFIDSSGLKFLLDTHALAERGNWTLQLLKPGEQAMRVFTITGTDRHLPFIDEDAD